MGGIGNVVVNTIVRMFTKKAVGKAMKSAKSMGGGKANANAKAKRGKKGGAKKGGASEGAAVTRDES